MSAMRGEGAQARWRKKVIHAPNDQAVLDRFAAMAGADHHPPPPRLIADPERVERDLARLVLGIVELLRQLIERQAVRRVESGALREEEIERLGETLLRLETRMSELKEAFGLKDQELTLDLGPLRNLVSECE